MTHRRTHQAKPVYEHYIESPLSPHPDNIFPTTLAIIPGTTAFTSKPSQTPITPFKPTSPSTIWHPKISPPPLQNTPGYFQKLIGPHPPTEAQCYDIFQELLQDALVVCSDGAYEHSSSVPSHGWVFGTNTLEIQQASGAGPVDGHPKFLSSFRAELSGIVTILYFTHHICEYYHNYRRTMKCHCGSKGALRNVFDKTNTGVKPYLSTDHDLVELAQQLLTILPNQHQQPHFKTVRKPLPPPNYTVCLLHDNTDKV
jgi:hypothetical protein